MADKNNFIDSKSVYARLHPDEFHKEKKKFTYNKYMIFEDVKHKKHK